MTRAVERLSIDWPAEREDVCSKSRLDESRGVEIIGENGITSL